MKKLISFNAVATLLLVLSVAVNVGLAAKVRSLQDKLDITQTGHYLQPGAGVSPMGVKALDGSEAEIAYSGQALPTVVYVFSTTCHWCKENLESEKALAASTAGRYRFVALALDADRDAVAKYVGENGLTFPVYYGPSTATMRSYRLGGTPQTIVISSDGKVVEEWSGAYTLGTKAEVEKFFAVNLPGVRPMSDDDGAQTVN
jgi:hypothetical protein